ncbi:hypothetical protein RM863_25065 [Streptomyces sp. DSM 41014]|uniref:Uncharacterized protein n=1 Tax=Streptomyces hintoniae TaxID=3075521 RepID=A0ABU2UQ47_9ACTN|nr:hypothetical protein [Streptomyces sp. DSM 41014]MDT0475402.1 hypothetical protein [Streptomyces sp. DSM 41014]
MGEGSAGSGQGVFSGIDPDAFKGTADSVQRDQEKLRERASYYKSQLAYYGIGSAELGDILRVADWAAGEIPLLKRRHHLAIGLENDPYPGFSGMVRIDESRVGKGAQARADGKKLGEEFKQKIDDGEPVPPELFESLRVNGSDADYLKAFYGTLGPKRLLWLSNEMGDRFNEQYKRNPDLREIDREVLAETFAVYSRVAFEGKTAKEKQRLWNKWFDSSATVDYEGFRPDRLTPLLKGGSFDKDFLVALGDRVFEKDTKTDETRFLGNGGLGEGEWGKDSYQQLFAAIAKDPQASGEWFDHNSESALTFLYPTGPWKVDEPRDRGKAYFDLLNAATVELRQTNPSLAEKNTAQILFDNYQKRKGSDTKGIHPITGTQALYASIITAYWKDLEYGVTSPVNSSLWGSEILAKGEEKYKGVTKWNAQDYVDGQDPGRDGLEVNEKLWRAMMEESARDPAAAGTVSALFQVYNTKMVDLSHATRESKENATAFNSMKRGMMQQFYVTTFKTASIEAEGDIDTWVDQTNAFRESVIDTAATVAAGAAGGAGLAGAKGAAIGVAHGMGSEIATGWIKDLAKADANDAPKGLKERFEGVKEATVDFSWQADYQENASSAWKYHRVEKVTLVTKGEDGKLTTKEYTGDPSQYAKGAGNFLDKGGKIVKYSEMTSAQRTAYSAWLEDPAVVAAVWPEFSVARNARDYPGQDE